MYEASPRRTAFHSHARRATVGGRRTAAGPALAAAVAGVVLTWVVPGAALAQVLDLAAGEFTAASGAVVAVEIGTLRVPERHDLSAAASAEMLELAVIRFPSTAAEPGPPTILLEGGPGSSGTANAAGSRFELIQRLRAFGDVIVLDQRGTGDSTPRLDCRRAADLAPGVELTLESWLAAVEPPSTRCARDWARAGVELSAYNSRQSAEDLDVLRAALGAPTLVVWGQSYGTQLALTYVRRHPERVDRAILHGVLPHDGFVPLPKSTDKVLKNLARLARNDPGAAGAYPDLVGLLQTVLERLDANPVRVPMLDPASGEPIEVLLGGFEVRFAIQFIILGDRTLMSRLPAWVADMESGEFAEVAVLGLALRRWQPRAMALLMAVTCSTGADPKRQRKAERQAARSILGLLPSVDDACPPWSVDPLGADFLEPVESDVPILLVSGTLDSVTPPSDAKTVARGFPNRSSLTLTGGTHSDTVHGDPRILDLVDEFMATGATSVKRLVMPPWSFSLPSSERR